MTNFDPDRLKRIDAWLARNVEIGRYTGCSALIAEGGDEVWFGATGSASPARDLPFARDTITRIYSMTKMVTSIGLMMLVERGFTHLDRPLSDFIPEFTECHALVAGAQSTDDRERVACPTLHHLLTHTAGMTYSFNPGMVAELYADNEVDFGPGSGGLEAAVARLANMPLAFKPGSGWEYSVGVDVIGRVIEIITGETLDAWFLNHIFAPLGMVDTGFDLPNAKIDRFADCFVKLPESPLHLQDDGTNSDYGEGRVETLSGGGGLVSTIDDYWRFGEMIRQGGQFNGERLVSNRTLAFMRRNHLAADIASMGPDSFAEMPMTGMGFGIGGGVVLEPTRTRMPGSVGDYGWGGMASTYFWTDPVEDLCCIFFTQLIPSSAYPNRAEFKALVHAALTD